LALGDSIAYGLDIRLLMNPPLPQPSAFVGYPEIVAKASPLGTKQELNASCPGETSTSFITAGPDYGCHSNGPDGEPPFKTWIGLHTDYSGAQLDFAVAELSSNKNVKLVTLGIGSNDALVLLRNCQGAADPNLCFSNGFPAVLQTYRANLAMILSAIRVQGGYSGKIVLVATYSPSAALIPVAVGLNTVTYSVGKQFHASYADAFTAFQIAALPYGGDVCKAGLLIPLPNNTCDIHPSPKGRDILAAVVLVTTAFF
jgi:lysophospholipase L1-like esterase